MVFYHLIVEADFFALLSVHSNIDTCPEKMVRLVFRRINATFNEYECWSPLKNSLLSFRICLLEWR